MPSPMTNPDHASRPVDVAPNPAQGTQTAPPEQLILQMAVGKWVSQALKVAAELGVADVLADGAKDADEIARRTASHPDALYRLLRALAAMGVFQELPARRFANNSLSAVLRSDVPGSARAMVRWIGEESAWHAWADFAHSVRTGKPAFDHVHGEQAFDYFAKHPESAAVFNAAMTAFSAVTGPAVARAYDFSGVGKLVDVGGGQGGLLLAVAERYPRLRGVVFDRAEVIAGARAVLDTAPAGARIECVAGDFFAGVPRGADAYMMKHIIHDWDDDRCIQILAHCAWAMAPGGRVLVVDQVIRDGADATFSKIMDLEMLAMTTGGRERTAAEFASLLERAGLELTRIVPTDSVVSVIEATAASVTRH